MSTDDEAKIMRAVGRRLKFKYPGREGVRRGTLRYREIARSAEGRTGAWYWTVRTRSRGRGSATTGGPPGRRR